MKRSGFIARKTPLKSTGVKKRKVKTPEQRAREKLWDLCKQIIRKMYGNTCYTCDKSELSGSSWQTGHFIPSSVCGVFLRYDLRNLRPQCYRCNIDLSGNGAVFYRLLVEREGSDYVDELFRDKQRIIKGDLGFYNELIERYTQVLSDMH